MLPDTENIDGGSTQDACLVLEHLQTFLRDFLKDMKIRDINVIKGRVSLLTFKINKLKIDITINRGSDILKAVFVEQSMFALDLAFEKPITRQVMLLGKLLCVSANMLGSSNGRLPT